MCSFNLKNVNTIRLLSWLYILLYMIKRRILFFHGEFPAGGAERVTMDIADFVAQYGYETYVITHQINSGSYSNIKVIEFQGGGDVDSQENADFIIHTLNSLKIDIFILPICLLSRLDFIKSKVDSKLIFACHSTPFWEITARLHRRRGRARGSFFKMLEWGLLTYPKIVWLKKYDSFFINQYKFVYDQVDAFTVLCEEYKQILLNKMGVSLDEQKVHVIYNSERQCPNVNLNKKKQILFVGRMSYYDKRVDRLLDIWGMIYKKVPDWELILVGGGKELPLLQAKSQKMKLQRIRFAGHSDHVDDFYRDASVLCLTSAFEGWPLCLTEAQANGVVPVAFDCVAGIRQILSPSSVNGCLVPSFSLHKYAEMLLSLLMDSEKLQKMRNNVILKSKEYSPEIVGQKWLGLFESLL